jgi:crotonobetainyl-CoA:carnitine CoA-transferase CaiB-like acyl-CoA transferase
MSALQGLRIIELASSVAGEFCGRLLADFGADLVKIEAAGVGSSTRQMAPFAGGGPGGGGAGNWDAGDSDTLERSGLFAHLNTGKRSVALDLASDTGRAQLARLVGGAVAVIDDHALGFLEGLGLSPADCAARHPGLVLCAVTPFGYDAPADMRKAYSLNVFHSSGWGYHSPTAPDPGTPPLKGAGRFLADYESGLSAALALTAALHARGNGSGGQFVDVSQQASLTSLADYVVAQMVAGNMDVNTSRAAFDLGGPATFYKCSDGYVYLFMTEPTHWNGLYQLMGEPAWMREFPDRWLELHLSPERIQTCRTHVAAWMQHQSRVAVAERAQKLGVAMVPVNTARDLLESAQLNHRGYFSSLRHPVIGSLRYPTAAYQFSATPVRLASPAPSLGQHTIEVMSEVAAAPRKQSAAGAAAAAAASSAATGAAGSKLHRGPLHGVRVLEHTKVWAGPYTGKLLALLGAEVIRVESLDSLDVTRRYGVKDINAAPGFQAVNPGKLSVQLSLKSAEGRRLMGELVKRCDIFVENLRPGAVARQGFGYEALRALRPDIIAISMSMWGNDGPLSYQTGYAPSFSALAGLSHLVGLPDGAPKLLNIRYGDSTYGTVAAFAAVVALLHRQRTGQGQFVDVSAVESIAMMLGDAFIQYGLTGQVPSRDANRHSELAPHGCYPCADEDWISIAVGADEEWRALCAAMARPALASDFRFASRAARQAHAAELDQLLAAWTAAQDARELSASLRSCGIAAFKSLNSVDLIADETLWQRSFYQQVTDAAGQQAATTGAPWRMSMTPTGIAQAAPILGQHNDYVYGELLGLSVEQREQLRADKVMY